MATHMGFNHYVHDTDFQISIDPFLLNQDLSQPRKPSMVENNLFNIPLSPPSSPRLSQFQSEQDNSWQHQDSQHSDNQDSSDNKMSLLQSDMAPSLTLDTKPMLRSHKSFPYPMQRMSGTSVPIDTPSLHGGDSPSTTDNDLTTPNLGDLSSSDMPQITFGGSAPSSPLSNFAPTSPHKDDDNGELHGLGIELGSPEEGKKPMTAAEIRAHKRKMKRFRLTHNQTRFLMSEFARQAHPDAAHRERLAREIPGLTPRQVQVWFQNRRAKLKRLTSDDRERMMRSRALPDDFDMTQALHSPFGAIQNVNSTLSSPGGYSTMSDGNMIRPLSLDSLRRIPDGPHHMSPIPGYGGFNFTPPQSVTDGMSPVSPAGDSPFGYSPTIDGQRRSNPFGGPLTSPGAFTSHPQIPRLHMHDRDPRSRPEGLTSPLRPTLTYQGHEMNSPGSPLGHHPESSGPPSMMPYGLGYSYPNTVSNFATTTNSRMRPNGPSRPQSTRPGYSPTQGPPQSPFPSSMSMMSSPHHFSNPFMRSGSPLEHHDDGEEVCG